MKFFIVLKENAGGIFLNEKNKNMYIEKYNLNENNSIIKEVEVTTKKSAVENLSTALEGVSFKKFYSTKNGFIKGIFIDWTSCQDSTQCYSNPSFKSFLVIDEALDFMKIKFEEKEDEKFIKTDIKSCSAYVDGSFNIMRTTFGYGVVIIDDATKEEFYYNGCSTDKHREFTSMRNVAGEIYGAMVAVKNAIDKGYQKITIYYDYSGIENWVTGEWQSNKIFTQEYQNFMQKKQKQIEIDFQKVAAHTGVKYNEIADKLAKKSCGLL